MPRESISYDFHRFDTDGVKKRFFGAGRTTPWSRLKSAQTVYVAAHKRWQTVLIFNDGEQVRMTAGRVPFASSSQERYAEILALVCVNAPTGALVDETTRDIATWGTRDVRRMTKRDAGTLVDAETLYARAAIQRVWLEHKKALKSVAEALLRDPRHGQAHALRVTLLGETGATATVVFAAASQWAESCPNDAEARLTSLRAGIWARDIQAIERAAVVLSHAPLDPALAFILADYYFSEKRYALAMDLLDRLVVSTEDDELRSAAMTRRDYTDRYASNVRFRRAEVAKNLWRHTLAWLPLVAIVALYGWRAYEAWYPRTPKPNPEFEEQRVEMTRRMERMNRKIQDLTGRITASDDEVRRRAVAGEAAAQYTLALDLLKQTQQELRIREGKALLEAAAAQDYRWALLDLGEYLMAGEVFDKDVPRALGCLEKAAELGSPRAAMLAGEMYSEGKEIAADPIKALALFEQSAGGGNNHGATRAGWAYEKGKGVPVDLKKAMHFYLQAAGNNNRWAQERVTDLLSNPRSPVHDAKEAARWMRRGAEAGSNRLRLFELKALLQGADHTPEVIKTIIDWNKELAETDDVNAPYAAYDLGYYYWSAMCEPFDLQTGLHYFELAANRDMPAAVFMLAHAKIFGVGTARDLQGARELRSKLDGLTKTNPRLSAQLLPQLDKELVAAEIDIPLSAKELSVVHRSPPAYPFNLRRAGVVGEALIDFEVQPNGFVDKVKVIKATHPEFAAAATLAVSTWRLVPKSVGGSRVPTHMQMPIVFTLNAEPASSETVDVQ